MAFLKLATQHSFPKCLQLMLVLKLKIVSEVKKFHNSI